MGVKVWRRLEQLKLQHLAELVVLQAERIEALEAELERAQRDAHNAEVVADMWRYAAEQPGVQLGVTRDGQIGVMQ